MDVCQFSYNWTGSLMDIFLFLTTTAFFISNGTTGSRYIKYLNTSTFSMEVLK